MVNKIDVAAAERAGRERAARDRRAAELTTLREETGSPERLREALYDVADTIDQIRESLPREYAEEISYEATATSNGHPLLEFRFYKNKLYITVAQIKDGNIYPIWFHYLDKLPFLFDSHGVPNFLIMSQKDLVRRWDWEIEIKRAVEGGIEAITRDGGFEVARASRAERKAERAPVFGKFREIETAAMIKRREERRVELAETTPFMKSKEERQNTQFVRYYVAFMAVSAVAIAALLLWGY